MSFTPLKINKLEPKKKAFLNPLKIGLMAGVFLLLLVGIVYTVFFLNKPTVTQQKAYYSESTLTFSCNKWKLELKAISESPECREVPPFCNTGGAESLFHSAKTYSTTFRVQALNNTPSDPDPEPGPHPVTDHRPGEIRLTVIKNSNFCKEGCGEDHPGSCMDCCWSAGEQPKEEVVLNGANDYTQMVTISRKSPGPDDLICGSYQTDLMVESMQNKESICPGADFAGKLTWGLCQTGITCPQPSPTPSPTPEITNTPTPTPSPTTPVPSATPTPTPTTTPGPSATPTPTNTPTPTPNPKCGDSCSNNSQCPGDHLCNGGKCVLAQCVQAGVTCDSSKCSQIAPSNTPVPTETILTYITSTPGPTSPPKSSPTLAETGGYGRWPFIIGPLLIIGIGLLL